MKQQQEKPLWLQIQGWLIDSGFELQHNRGKNFHTFSFVKNQTVYDVWQFRDLLWEDGLELDDSKMIQVYERILFHTVQNFKQRIRNYMLNFAYDDIYTLDMWADYPAEKPMIYYEALENVSVNVYLKNPHPNDVMEFANEPDFPEFDYWCKANRATWLDHDFVLRLIVQVANELYYEICELE